MAEFRDPIVSAGVPVSRAVAIWGQRAERKLGNLAGAGAPGQTFPAIPAPGDGRAVAPDQVPQCDPWPAPISRVSKESITTNDHEHHMDLATLRNLISRCQC